MISIVFVSIILLSGLTHGGSVFQCKKKFQVCGDNRCCCHDRNAVCNGTKALLSYIPSFSKRIRSLTFVYNSIPNVSKSTFKNISDLRLQLLVIENDGIVNVSRDAFMDLQYLRNLSIQGSMINTSQLFKAIGGINKHLLKALSLKNIALSGEYPEELTEALNGSILNRVRLNMVDIKTVNIHSFASLSRLTVLGLSNNTITEFNASSGHPSLRILYLTNNRITWFPPEFCATGVNKYPNLESLYLDQNLISVITNVYIGCLKRLKFLEISANMIKRIPGNLIANLPNMVDLHMNQMCGLGGHNVAINRYAFNSTSLKRLELGLNNIIFNEKYVETDIFGSCKELTYLNFKRNNFVKLTGEQITRVFSPLSKLEKLFLEATHLRSIPTLLLTNFTNLQVLILDGNGIQELGDSLLGPRNLRHISVQGNNIRIVGPHSFPPSVMKTLKRLNLDDNPFTCTCENLWFRNWVGENGRPYGTNITLDNWPGRYTCYTPSEWNEKRFVNYRPTKASCFRNTLILILSITFSSILVIVLISIPVCIRYRWHLMYAWYRVTKRSKDPERRPLMSAANVQPYIYVIYHDEDRHFVHDTLCKIVELDLGMKLFVWHRDADAGGMANIMFDAIESSHCVLAVVSNNFVLDGWCEFQLELGLSKKNSIRKDCLTLILLEDLDVSLLRKSWCVTLVKNATIQWCLDVESVQGKLCVEKLNALLSCTYM